MRINIEPNLHLNNDNVKISCPNTRIFPFLHQLILISELDRSRISNARPDIQHMHLLRSPKIHIMANLRTRPHQTHIPHDNIDKLRQLIDLEFSDKIPAASNPRIMPADSHQTPLVSSDTHRTKLENPGIPVMPPHTNLPIKHRPRRIQLNPNRHD